MGIFTKGMLDPVKHRLLKFQTGGYLGILYIGVDM